MVKTNAVSLREIDGFYTRLIETSLTVKEPEQEMQIRNEIKMM